MPAKSPLYDRDFFAWSRQQAELLRAGKLAQADIENIAEEIDSMGRTEKRELISRLSALLLHLLKWRHQPDKRGPSCEASIRVQCNRLADTATPDTVTPQDQLGIFDARYGVTFGEGFEIFRTYLGMKYVARVCNGSWLLRHTNKTYRSLNELSSAIGAKTENAWANWYFRTEQGERQAVSELRDPDRIAIRQKDREVEMLSTKGAPLAMESDGTWRDDVRVSLERIGGKASLHSIYAEVRTLRRGAGRSIPTAFEAVVRKTLEENSSDSDAYRGAQDIFSMPEGKGVGIWAIR